MPRRNEDRPSLLDPRVREIVLDALRVGCAYHVAARAAGIDPSTLRNCKRSRRPILRAFHEQMQQARAQCERDLVGAVNEAKQDDWRAAGWLLSRLFPERWREEQKLTVDARTGIVVYLPQEGAGDNGYQVIEGTAEPALPSGDRPGVGDDGACGRDTGRQVVVGDPDEDTPEFSEAEAQTVR